MIAVAANYLTHNSCFLLTNRNLHLTRGTSGSAHTLEREKHFSYDTVWSNTNSTCRESQVKSGKQQEGNYMGLLVTTSSVANLEKRPNHRGQQIGAKNGNWLAFSNRKTLLSGQIYLAPCSRPTKIAKSNVSTAASCTQRFRITPKLANIILGCYLLCALAAARTGERSRIASSALHTTNVDGAAAILHRRVSSALAGAPNGGTLHVQKIRGISIYWKTKLREMTKLLVNCASP